MKKKRSGLWKLTAVALILLMAAMSLAGCGKPDTLEEVIKNDQDTQDELDKIAEENDMDIDVKDNTVTYTVTLDSEVDDSMVDTYKSAFDEAFKGEEDDMADAVQEVEDGSDIKGVIFKVVVKDKSGDEVYTCEFDDSGMVE